MRRAAAFSLLSGVLATACHTSRPAEPPVGKPAIQSARDTLVPVTSRAVWSTIGAGSVSFISPRPDTEPRKLVMLDAFVPAAPAVDSGGECQELPLPTSNVIKSVAFPTIRDSRASIMLTADMSGKLERYSERRGMPRIAFAGGFPTPMQRDSAFRAARASTRWTTIELDYASGTARLVNEGGGLRYEFVETSLRNVEQLDRLGRPGARAKRAVALCGGMRAAVKAPPPAPPRAAAPAIVLQTFFDALDAQAWNMAASLVDERVIVAYRLENLKALIGWARGGAKTYAANGPPDNQDIRFEPVQDTTLIARYDTLTVPGLGRVITLGQLGRLSPREFAALGFSSHFDRSARGARRHIIGTVLEGDSIAHVLFRTQWTVMGQIGLPLQASEVRLYAEVAQLRRIGGEWRIAASASMLTGGIDLWNRVVTATLRR